MCNYDQHLIKDCPDKRERASSLHINGNKQSQYQPNTRNIHKTPTDPGLYVQAIFNGVETECLVDTGATITLMSSRLYRSMDNISKMSLNVVQRSIVMAERESLNVDGRTDIEIQIGSLL